MSQVESSCRVDVRKLPPTLTAQEFDQSVAEFAADIVYSYFRQGQIKEKETVFSRAHLNFSTTAKAEDFIGRFKQKFVDQSTKAVYEPILQKSLYQVNIQKPEETSANEKDFRVGLMYQQFKQFQEQQQRLSEQKAELSQIERKANEENDEKAKKFEKVKTPILETIEQKKKEERRRKMREKINAGTNQIYIPRKN